MRKRRLPAIVMALLLSVAVCGCANGGSEPDKTDSAPTDADSAESNAPVIEYTSAECFTYRDTEDGIVITRYNGADSEVNIPAQIEDKPVIGTDTDVFFDYCDNLTSITIPDSVTSIGAQTFFGCRNIKSMVIPDSVTEIGGHVFHACEGLESITLSKNITEINEFAFFQCKSLTEIVIPDGVTAIHTGAFSDAGLASITIPDSVTLIGSFAFGNNKNLTSVTLPDGITKLEMMAFDGCENITVTYRGNTYTYAELEDLYTALQ